MRAAELLVWMGDFNYRIIGERDAVVGSRTCLPRCACFRLLSFTSSGICAVIILVLCLLCRLYLLQPVGPWACCSVAVFAPDHDAAALFETLPRANREHTRRSATTIFTFLLSIRFDISYQFLHK